MIYVTILKNKDYPDKIVYCGNSLYRSVEEAKSTSGFNINNETMILMFTPAQPTETVVLKDVGGAYPKVAKCNKCTDEIVFVNYGKRIMPVNANSWGGEETLEWIHKLHTKECRGLRETK